ncbi:MAG: acyl-[ACP]--phospholipid O-acyltransferase [Rickettsiaceae bacterium]|nr:acyl-[ACP]--phospholipid O-acyltransferase [Rickettsiaceae bacterium]
MATTRLYLLSDRRFYPMLVTQACGCFNDNLIKSAFVMLITYNYAFESQIATQVLIALSNIALIFPFIIFAGLAGQISDKYDKAKVVQLVKLLEIPIVMLGIYGFMANSFVIILTTIALIGIHSTFFIPIKYSILPEQLEKDELIAANGYIESSTFIFLLLGILLGGFAVNGLFVVLFLMLAVSIAGFIFSLLILPTNTHPEIKINYNLIGETWDILKYTSSKHNVFLSILGISWFWFVCAGFMGQIPILTKEVFWSDQYVANLFLAVFSIGVGIGSFLCNRIFGHEIQTKYVFLSSILISFIGFDLFLASRINEVTNQSDALHTLSVFLTKFSSWRILIDFFLLSVFAGLYIVPLYAVMQCFSHPAYRSRVIAANNVMNSVFMIGSNILIYLLVASGCSVTTIIFMLFFVNAIVAFYIYKMIPENEVIPEPFIKMICKSIFDFFYKVEVRGIENYHKAGKRVVIVANHPSYLEPLLLGIYLPEKPIFPIRTRVSYYWWVRPITRLVKTYKMDSTNPMAMKHLIEEIKKNKKIVIFPEGRRSTTGALMKIYEGPGMIADKSDAVILPIRIEGTEFTMTSRVRHVIKNSYFPKITITILPPVKMEVPDGLEDSKLRRKYLSNRLYNIMSDMMFESSDYKKTIFESLIDSRSTYGRNLPIIFEGRDNKAITYIDLMKRSFILGGALAKLSDVRDNIGIMLPTSCAAAITFFALHAYNRAPAMINFSLGYSMIVAACTTAQLKLIITSRQFIDAADLKEIAQKLSEQFTLIYLEDIGAKLTLFEKLSGFLGSMIPMTYYKYINKQEQKKEEVAAILFTSGTEGNPKAVALSHENLQANVYQMKARVDFLTTDIVFNALPMFHCFGLMAGCVLPILAGVKTYFYPSPLHYRVIPEMIYDVDATIMLGTDTFLNGYAKFADPYDFYSVRYAFAGAEKLRPETRKLWFEKFGVRIFEGYGVTEASPVVSVNTPMHDLHGSVGRLLPGIEAKVIPVDGIKEGGRLYIKGPNIMMGYIFHDNPGAIVPIEPDKSGEKWYDTGDIVDINEDGYIIIKGRAKRFAKIAGEMVSLATVEEVASSIDSSVTSAAIHIDDASRGEVIILFTESTKVHRDSINQKINELGLSKLLMPRIVKFIQEIPVLSTGKTNYRKLLSIGLKSIEEDDS